MRSAAVRGAAIVAAGLCIAAAHAHGLLQRSEPPANATLAEAPPELRLVFSEPVEPAFVRIGVRVGDKPAAPPSAAPQVDADGRTVRLPLAERAPGRYGVEWSVVAKDGHRTQGRFAFTVKPR